LTAELSMSNIGVLKVCVCSSIIDFASCLATLFANRHNRCPVRSTQMDTTVKPSELFAAMGEIKVRATKQDALCTFYVVGCTPYNSPCHPQVEHLGTLKDAFQQLEVRKILHNG